MCYGKFVTYAKQHACSVLFFSRPRYKAWAHHGRTFASPLISVLCHTDWLFHGESCHFLHRGPVHVLMLSIQTVRGFPRLRAPCIVPCIILQLLCFLCFARSNGSLFTPALWRTHSFVFFAVHETCRSRIFLSPSQRRQDVFLHSFWESMQHAWRWQCEKLHPSCWILAQNALKFTCSNLSNPNDPSFREELRERANGGMQRGHGKEEWIGRNGRKRGKGRGIKRSVSEGGAGAPANLPIHHYGVVVYVFIHGIQYWNSSIEILKQKKLIQFYRPNRR